MKIIWLILSGIVGGVLGGMGMGGGTLLIPILTIFLSFEQQSAQSVNLLVFIPMAIVSIIIHNKNKLIKIKSAIPLIITGVVGAVGGSFLTSTIKSENLKIYFGIFLIILGIFQFISLFIFKNAEKNNCK